MKSRNRNRNRKWFGFALMGNGEPEILYSANNLRLIARLVLELRSKAISQAVDTAAKDCMAAKGYIQVPEDQAEAKSEELAATNAQRQASTLPSRKAPGP